MPGEVPLGTIVSWPLGRWGRGVGVVRAIETCPASSDVRLRIQMLGGECLSLDAGVVRAEPAGGLTPTKADVVCAVERGCA